MLFPYDVACSKCAVRLQSAFLSSLSFFVREAGSGGVGRRTGRHRSPRRFRRCRRLSISIHVATPMTFIKCICRTRTAFFLFSFSFVSCRATSGSVAVGKREEKRNIIPTHSGGTMFRLFLILRDRIDYGSAWRD